MSSYQHIQVPAEGRKITVNADNSLNVPDEPVIPYIEHYEVATIGGVADLLGLPAAAAA